MTTNHDWNDILRKKIEAIDVAVDVSKKKDFETLLSQLRESTRRVDTSKQKQPELDYSPLPVDRRADLDYIDKLHGDSKLALILIAELVAQGKADFLLLEHPEIAEFWNRHCNNLGILRAKEAEQKRREDLKESALNKLTDEEKEVLGIK